MRFIKSIRNAFSRVTGRKPANDNTSLRHIISDEQRRRALNPPTDNTVIETLHGRKVADPFRPLEDLSSSNTKEWIARQNKRFEDFIKPSAEAKEAAMSFLDSSNPEGPQETIPRRCGKKYVVHRIEPGEERWSIHIKDTPESGGPSRLLLDPLQLDPEGKADIVSTHFTRDGKTVAYVTSVSGSDKMTLRFMDVATGKNIDLVYEGIDANIKWDRDGKGFHYNHPVDGTSKSEEVRYHRMGTPVEEDKVIYTPATPETHALYFRLLKDSKSEIGSYEWISLTNAATDKNVILARRVGSTEPFHEIFRHEEGSLHPMAEIKGKIYALTDLDAPRGKIICLDVNDPAPEKWRTILPESDDILSEALVWQNRLFAVYSHDTGAALKVFDLAGNHLHDVPIPPLSTFTVDDLTMDGTTCFITYENFQEVGNTYKYDVSTNKLTLHKESNIRANLKDCIVERIHGISKDGTKVPMTVIRHPDTKLDGSAAALLYGYGGFNTSLEPQFMDSVAQWVRSGGIYVQANLRGGGEYGAEWYDAGRRENKQNTFDDFIACAEKLIGDNYTSNKRLAIQGGSNGGLLTLATVLQRPDLFGAVVSEVPVTDMFRFHIGSHYGYSWKSEYGDPNIREDFNNAAKYSPLHNVPEGFKHPPILIKTAADDDRVLPWHSFKMAATLQALEDKGSQTFLSIMADAGHSDGMTEEQRQEDIGEVYAFLERTLGPIDQDAYKATLKQKPAKKTPLLKRLWKKFG